MRPVLSESADHTHRCSSILSPRIVLWWTASVIPGVVAWSIADPEQTQATVR
jgi:hypothetical protein